MAIEAVKEYFRTFGREGDVREMGESCATVELAANALSVIPARIAKTLSFKSEPGCILVVAAGDAKVDNRKFKDEFGVKAKMLSPEEVLALTGHAVGGVCPFAIKNHDVKAYLDVSLQRFTTIFPSCGASNSAIELTCGELAEYARSPKWVDDCKDWQE